MSESNKVGAASLADFVRATQDAELDDGDAERITTLLANTKRTLATPRRPAPLRRGAGGDGDGDATARARGG